MPLDLPWESPLNYRKGGATRLEGIDVYYDFDWFDTFGHTTSQFRNGQRLAKRVKAVCPLDKTPALLLTSRDEVNVGLVETPLHLVFVLNNLPDYVRTDPDASLSFLAGLLGSRIMRIGQLNELAGADPDEIRAFLDLHLNAEYITTWLAGRADRLDELRGIPGVGGANRTEITAWDAVASLQALGNDIDAEVVAAVAALFGAGTDRAGRLELLRAVTDDPTGRSVTGEVLVARTPERIADARQAVSEYQALLDSGAGETPLQEFIEQHPWLLGLHYVRVRPRRDIPRATADFILERFDGFHDLLELKDPQDSVIAAPEVVDGVQPSPSAYRLSRDLAQALAQVHLYRDILTTDAETVLRRYGLERTRDPRVIVVIGHALPVHRAEVLRELNKSLHRIEIVPYDALAERANTVLANVERYLVRAETF